MSNRFVIATARLLLKPVGIEDVDYWWVHVSNPVISKYMAWDPHKNKHKTCLVIKKLINDCKQDKGYTWSIFVENQFCGIISLIDIKRHHHSLTYNRAELAYWLGTDFQRKGYMNEAATAVIDFAIENLNIERLVVYHDIDNIASRKLIERLYFNLVGIEHNSLMKNGEWRNTAYYELLKNDIIARRHHD